MIEQPWYIASGGGSNEEGLACVKYNENWFEGHVRWFGGHAMQQDTV